MLEHFDALPVALAAATSSDVQLTADDDNVPPQFTKIIKDSGLTIVTCQEILKATGMAREQWRAALEDELNSLKNGCLRTLTAAEAYSTRPRDILPMKVVAGEKAADASGYRRKKARGCVCGNWEAVDPAELTYTQNVDIASVRMALAM